MKSLLKKEFSLVITPMFFLLTLFGALILIPQWPYFIALMYFLFISLPNLFILSRSQNDVGYSALLPIGRKDIVKARVMSISILEVTHILVAAVFVGINMMIYPNGNGLLDANISFIGLSFVMFALANIVFFPLHYKTAFKVAIPTVLSVLVAIVFAAGVELLVIFVPAFRVIDGKSNLLIQFAVLIIGIAFFVAANYMAYRISARKFERIDI